MAIAANKPFVNMTIPSGQGKSFIILLLARYYIDNITDIDSVVIFSKDEVTHNQFAEYQADYLEGLDQIELACGADFENYTHYQRPLFILDEADRFFEEDLAVFTGKPYTDPVIGGLVAVKNKVIGLSATCDDRNR